MDKIAIISDVHGNLTALNAVLKDIDSKGISKIYCLGDSVIKCANPDKVVDILRNRCEVILKGNCDEFICKPNVQPGRFWSRDILGEERANFIYNLPVSYEFYMSGHLIRLFHASPFSLEHVFNPMYDNSDTRYHNLVEMMNDKEDDETNKFSTMASYAYLEGNLNSKKLETFNITLVRVPYLIDDEIKALEDSNMPNNEMIIKSLKTAIH